MECAGKFAGKFNVKNLSDVMTESNGEIFMTFDITSAANLML
jgi:hypothetical protein